MSSLTFLYIVFLVAIIIHFCSAAITILTVIPLQAKEAQINDRLRKLRKQLLTKGILSLIIDIATILALTARFVIGGGEAYRYIIVTLILIHALGILGKAIIDHLMYHQEYP